MKKIAFVDDEKNILDGLRRMLRSRRKEWDLKFYLSGDEVLEAFAKDKYDILISDMCMPHMNGSALLQKIKEISPQTHRIALSGYAKDEIVLESLHAIHQFISKPADPEKVFNTIERSLRLHESLQKSDIKSIIGSIESLPSLPSVYDDLMQEISSEDASIERIGDIIERDIAISSSVLKIANSAFFGLVRHIESPAQAASILGLNAIKNIVLSTSVVHKFRQQGGRLAVIEQLNKMAQQVGILAANFAKVTDLSGRAKDHTQIAGMMIHLGDLVAEVFSKDGNDELGRPECYPLVGSYLLGIWSMPYPVVEAVRWYKQPALSNINELSPLVIVHAAWAMLKVYKDTNKIEFNSEVVDFDYLGSIVSNDILEKWKSITLNFCDNVISDDA